MPSPEIAPEAAVVEAVRDQVVTEIIARLTRELRHPLVLAVYAHQDSNKIGALGTIESKRKKGQAQPGEVRLRFRPTGDPNLFTFLADCRLTPDRRNPTYSGFSVEGHVTRDASTGACEATFLTWAVTHNDWDWDTSYW